MNDNRGTKREEAEMPKELPMPQYFFQVAETGSYQTTLGAGRELGKKALPTLFENAKLRLAD